MPQSGAAPGAAEPMGGTTPWRAQAHSTLAAAAGALPVVQLMAGLTVAALLIAGLYFGRDILMPLALAMLLGFVLDPLVSRLKRWGLPRTLAVVVVVVATMAVLLAGGLLLGSQVRTLSAELPTYQSNIQSKLEGLRASMRGPGMFDGALKTFDTLQKQVESADRESTDKGTARAAATVQRVQVEDKPTSPSKQAMAVLASLSGPLADAGIVLVFTVLVLLDRLDLRDRLVRLMGGSLQRSTDAMDEAGDRISKYLTMQLVVNVTYGIPMAAGLWFIGVPGALLWGAVAAVMRFVPYIGPMISAVFPVALAFAVDPGWNLVLWTVGLIVLLELVSNNVVEPWLYGASTGLSAMSLMVAATFWTALWGPIGLIMSTPLTVCLLVIGRHLPQLQFLDVLLGSQPALDAPTRVYQRLLAGDVDEALELSEAQVEAAGSVGDFYDQVGLAVLRRAVDDHSRASTAEHRLRLVSGVEELLTELRDEHPPRAGLGPVRVACIGGKWEVDTLAARMLAHALELEGVQAEHRAAGVPNAEYLDQLDLRGVQLVCLSYFSEAPEIPVRHLCRRLRRRWPGVRIVLALWNAPQQLLDEASAQALGADAVATSVSEAAQRTLHLLQGEVAGGFAQAQPPSDDVARVRALRASGVLTDERLQALFPVAAKRAAEIFDMPFAMVSLIDDHLQHVHGSHGQLALPGGQGNLDASDLNMPRELSMCGHVVSDGEILVVPDIARDARFAGNPGLQAKGLRFYAGAPLRDKKGHVFGALCLLDVEPRQLDERETRLMQAMADDLMQELLGSAPAADAAAPAERQKAPASDAEMVDVAPPAPAEVALPAGAGADPVHARALDAAAAPTPIDRLHEAGGGATVGQNIPQ